MSELCGFVDTGRTVIAMEGSDAREVLQGVVTNDMDQVAPGVAVYAALLTPQGKYLYDFFVLDGGQDQVLIDCSAGRASELAKRLSMYCLRRDARVVGPTDMSVVLAWTALPEATGGEPFRHDVEAGASVVRDPRDATLGWRMYLPGAVDLEKLGIRQGERQAYEAVRIEHGVPEGGVDLVEGETYPLEAGFERLSGVDFRKGCYVGQEVTARMKHKAVLRKGLAVVQVQGTAPPGTEITHNGRSAGTLRSTAGPIGIAHLRFDRAGTGMRAGDAVVDYEGPVDP